MPLHFNFIESLIDLQDIKVTSVNVNNGIVEIYAESKAKFAFGPKCHKLSSKLHDFRLQEYEHLYMCDKVTMIHLTICRYVCDCDLEHPFDETFSFIREYQHQTIPFEKFIFELCIKNTIVNVAKLINFS